MLGPALAIGGVPPEVVPAFLVGVTLLWLRLLAVSSRVVEVPRFAALGLVLCGVTLLQWIPLPALGRALLSPEISAQVELAVSSGVERYGFWGSLSPSPGDTGLEAARLMGLTLLFVAAAQLPWRVVTAAVVITGSCVALVGLLQAGFGVHAIYGVYRPVDINPAETAAMLSSFVNPNHQSALFLLGIFAAGGLLVDAGAREGSSREASEHALLREQYLVAMAALVLQTLALVLSRSRGALLVGVGVAPVAIAIAWFSGAGGTRRSRRRRARRQRWARRGLLLALYVGVVGVVLRYGAWEEVMSLTGQGPGDPLGKLRIAGDALALIAASPWVGIGRGAFIDVFPAVDSQPSALLHTHLEAAPVAMIVEWGVIAGTVAILGLASFWVDAVRQARGRESVVARRVVLCGLLALALQSLGDFSLEFLGVAASACALAGALARGSVWTLEVRVARRLVLGLGLGLLALSLWALPHTWTKRAGADQRIRDGARSPESALRVRPLDASLHVVIARVSAERGEHAAALRHARVATRLQPGSADAWLLRSTAELNCVERCDGDARVAREAVARALEQVVTPLRADVVEHLLLRFPEPSGLAPMLPRELSRCLAIVESLGERAPVYAGKLVAIRGLEAREPDLLAVQVSLALRAENAALALHAARLLRARAPDDLRGVKLMVQALRSFQPAREREIQALLEEALTGAWGPEARGDLEELMVRSLLASGTAEDRARVQRLMPKLLDRPAAREDRRRRHALKRELAGQE